MQALARQSAEVAELQQRVDHGYQDFGWPTLGTQYSGLTDTSFKGSVFLQDFYIAVLIAQCPPKPCSIY